MANQGLGKMHLDLYTSNSALTHKAKFWCNYVGALKGNQKSVLQENIFAWKPDFLLALLMKLFFNFVENENLFVAWRDYFLHEIRAENQAFAPVDFGICWQVLLSYWVSAN